jgi:hypothetical protein
MYLEFRKRRLRSQNSRKKPLLSFLLTREQADQRICRIGEKFGLFERDDEAACNALTNLYLSILSGGDTPLLTEAI